MTAIASITPAAEQTLALWAFFDSLRALGYSDIGLFEWHTPGVTEAFRAWAAAQGIETVDRPCGNSMVLGTAPTVCGISIAIHYTPAEIAANQESSK